MSRKENWKKIGLRAFTLVFITAVLVAGSILVENKAPDRYIYENMEVEAAYSPPEWNSSVSNVLFDQHSHTIYSDGKLTPEENILWHISQGFNAMAMTDHDNITGALLAQEIARTKYNDKIKVLVGQEWTTGRIHMNLLGISTLVPKPEGTPTDADIKAAIDNTHAQGGVAVVNHIPWSLRVGMSDHPTREQLLSWGIDYIEIVNTDEFDYLSLEFCEAHGLGIITGTDMHSPGKVYGWTTLWVSEYTEAAILNQIVNNRSGIGIIYNSTGSITTVSKGIRTNPAYEALKPLIYVGEMFQRLDLGNYQYDWVGISMFLVYLGGAFVMSEVLRWGVVKIRSKDKTSEETRE